ncbi:hypothetical protein Q1695_015881 [Nippostrongylus brasiliensis]|nr:hypothetical protein Q1695_015881 [Nippostrongylus brasiliensis]
MCISNAVLLLLFSAFAVGAEVQGNSTECWQLPYHDDLQENMRAIFEKYHKELHLTFDCQAMWHASHAAGYVMTGWETGISQHWCQYSRIFMDAFGITGLFTEPSLVRMPWDKIAQTAMLHPGTKYGCAYVRSVSLFGPYFATACIYAKKESETRCFCNL